MAISRYFSQIGSGHKKRAWEVPRLIIDSDKSAILGLW